MRSDQIFELIGLAFGAVVLAGLPRLHAFLLMRNRLLLALLAAIALTVGAALGFLAEQATQPSEFGQPANESD